MALKFFCVPARHPEAAEEELERFQRTHRVVSVDRRWVDDGEHSYWSLCVDYARAVTVAAEGTPAASAAAGSSGKPRVDYRERLSEENFVIYAELREWRKQVAVEESVPVYAVFTNEHLAQLVEGKVRTQAALEAINGVGAARAAKYGPRILAYLAALDDKTASPLAPGAKG